MIGNTIRYASSEWIGSTLQREEREGIVVDAFTKITGSIKGDSAFGFGEVKGNTGSERMYKVMYYDKYDSNKRWPRFQNIHDWEMKEIIAFANKPTPSDEKIIQES